MSAVDQSSSSGSPRAAAERRPRTCRIATRIYRSAFYARNAAAPTRAERAAADVELAGGSCTKPRVTAAAHHRRGWTTSPLRRKRLTTKTWPGDSERGIAGVQAAGCGPPGQPLSVERARHAHRHLGCLDDKCQAKLGGSPGVSEQLADNPPAAVNARQRKVVDEGDGSQQPSSATIATAASLVW